MKFPIKKGGPYIRASFIDLDSYSNQQGFPLLEPPSYLKNHLNKGPNIRTFCIY